MIREAKLYFINPIQKYVFKKSVTLLVLPVLVYFHILSRSNYEASRQKMWK